MDLGKTQFFALITKGVTTALGIIQSIIVIRLLSKGEFGLIGLVMSIGGVIGVSQHLGIVDGAIREIAVLKNRQEIAKVFWVANITRQLVTIPLSLLLFFFSGAIANLYDRPDITPYIQIFALILILQGLQDVFGATLTGLKKFIILYAVQIVTAAINIAVFAYLTWRFTVVGFFWAIVVTTALMVVLFGISIIHSLRHEWQQITWADIRKYGRQLMKIGIFMYIARIFFVVWQRLPLIVLGTIFTAEQLGDLNISLTFGSKLTIIAMALSEVNLAWMSSLFATRNEEFQRVVTRNMHRVLVVMTLLTLVMIFFTPEILHYIIGAEYLTAAPLIYVMTFAFFLYSLIDIGTSSVFVSADRSNWRAVAYAIMLAITGGATGIIILFDPTPFMSSLAVVMGAIAAYVYMVFTAYKKLNVALLNKHLALFLGALVLSILWLLTEPSLEARIIIFAILMTYIGWESHRRQLLPLPVLLRRKQDLLAYDPSGIKIICFAGASFDQNSWTNRQHMMSQVSRSHPVLYVEPRIWLLRYIFRYWRHPHKIMKLLRRIISYEKKSDTLYIKAQWNLIPWSREFDGVARINHLLNRQNVLGTAKRLGFLQGKVCVWVYDTEAAEYVSAFPKATVLYDCVDDHQAQAGAERNRQRIHAEEAALLKRANLVTVTSQKLLTLKKANNPNTHLVLNAGDVELFRHPSRSVGASPYVKKLAAIPKPILGSVGALDAYKIDFELMETMARKHPNWSFVFIGEPVITYHSKSFHALHTLSNVFFLGPAPRQEVPAYVTFFDICLIPYRANAYNEASFPLKFWEFMATGKPIIVSGVPELKEYTPVISYVGTADEFSQAAQQWLSHPHDQEEQRRALSQDHRWQDRASRVLQLLYRAIEENHENSV